MPRRSARRGPGSRPPLCGAAERPVNDRRSDTSTAPGMVSSSAGLGKSDRVTVPPVQLSHWPTPLDPAPRLSVALGLEPHDLWIKRDDLTDLGGGNKVRKLEYLVADALATGATVLVTSGGAQSNHARATAAAAARVGLGSVLVLGGTALAGRPGNLALEELLGAEVVLAEGLSGAALEGQGAGGGPLRRGPGAPGRRGCRSTASRRGGPRRPAVRRVVRRRCARLRRLRRGTPAAGAGRRTCRRGRRLRRPDGRARRRPRSGPGPGHRHGCAS